jgi:beta-aspartyl-peptidase (threonine type)
MMPARARWTLLVHGGAKPHELDGEQANRDGCLEALAAGRKVLESGGSATCAAEAAVRVLERLPVFNAGCGSALNAAGDVEMCAGIMDGRDLSAGAVAAIRGVRHPISVASALLSEKAVLLVGDGARAFAEERGLELMPQAELGRCAGKSSHDTVGAVALDSEGNLAAATSTGGLDGARVGRVGDSPMPGAGYYADNQRGAASLSGDGEAIARLAIAARLVDGLDDAGIEAEMERLLGRLPHLGGDGGAIAIAPDGRCGWWHNSPIFPVAMARDGEQPGVWLRKEEC